MFRRLSTEKPDENPLQLSATASFGFLSVTAAKSVSVGRLIATATYNRHLHNIINTYGEIEGMRVDFAHGRQLLNWEIGMFCAFSKPEDVLSIVARHVLQTKLSLCSPEVEDDESAQSSSSLGVKRSPISFRSGTMPSSTIRKSSQRLIAPSRLPFATVMDAVYSRLAMEDVVRHFMSPPRTSQDSSKLAFYIDPKSFHAQFLRVPVPHDWVGVYGLLHMEVNPTGFAVQHEGLSRRDPSVEEKVIEKYKMFLGQKEEHDTLMDDYFSTFQESIGDTVLGNDSENDARIRAYLHKRTSFQCDSADLLEDIDVMNALKTACTEWDLRQKMRRRPDGKSPPDVFDVYKLIQSRLQSETPDPALWMKDAPRSNELDVFSNMPTIRQMTSSMERIWVGSLFQAEDKKTIGWIKRRRDVHVVETYTEYFVVMPAERRVSVWTKRSYYNSLKPPWKTHVRSQMTLPALSAICLLSTCVYPSKHPAGDAALDTDLFEDNVRNAGRGIGYALSRLVRDHEEGQLRQMGVWRQNGLKLSSFVTLVWGMFPWLDIASKCWIIRETITLFNDSGVNIFISPRVANLNGSRGTFTRMMYEVESCSDADNEGSSDYCLPAVEVDGGMPAGGITIFRSSAVPGQFIQTRDHKSNWRYRRLEIQGNKTFIHGKKRQAVELPPNSVEQINVFTGAELIY